jgi:hypothetical protein
MKAQARLVFEEAADRQGGEGDQERNEPLQPEGEGSARDGVFF